MKRFTIALALVASPAAAEVTASSDGGFAIRNAASVKANPQRTFAILTNPALWWNSQHTYSGDAKNISLSVTAGGCFCETVPADGSKIEHARVVLARPASLLRLHGALGPLQAEGVTGSLSWDVKAIDGGGSEIVQTYVVGGFARGGAGKLAPIVDTVMREQLTRLKAYLDRP